MGEIDRAVLRLLQLMVLLLCVMTGAGSMIGIGIVWQNHDLQRKLVERTVVVSDSAAAKLNGIDPHPDSPPRKQE